MENYPLTTEGNGEYAFDAGTWEAPESRHVRTLRRLIWWYFWLLIIEGALRKWVVPSLSAPLLIVRDPVLLLIYLQALRCRLFPMNGQMVVGGILVAAFILEALVQIMAGVGGGPLVALYGLRTDFLHLPLIFVIPRVFSYRDVIKMGKWVLLLSIPMMMLMVMQYRASPGSWLNAATKADAQQLAYVGGKVRPSGTFSFITGASHFYVLASAFLIFGLTQDKIYPRCLLAASLLSVAVVQPMSGSRTMVISCGLVFVAALIFAFFRPNQSKRILTIAVLGTVAVAALSLTPFFREAIETFMTRWDAASAQTGGVQHGIIGRYFQGFVEPFEYLSQAGFIGKGLGMGTNAASAMLTGALVFLLVEGEWGRVVLEVGPFLGFAYLGYRLWLGGSIALRAAWGAKRGQLLPWLLACDCCRSIITEQLSQPTNLGFTVLVCGLCLAAFSEGWVPAETGFSTRRPITGSHLCRASQRCRNQTRPNNKSLSIQAPG